MFFAFRDIPTLPVWGATISCSVQKLIGCISIHAPRVGSDNWDMLAGQYFAISIHAPRVGSDEKVEVRIVKALDFNPRSPCGERPNDTYARLLRFWISIHAPRVGSDSKLAQYITDCYVQDANILAYITMI